MFRTMPYESELPLLGARYRPIEEIGRGGMSVIYRARDELIGRDVAVKLLREGGDARFRSVLRAEAMAYGRVNSPRVAHVYDYGETDDAVPYLVMELVDGEPLADSLARGPLPWREATRVGAELAAALAATHAQGLVHRDVTPANVIRTPDGVKLIDFGISALVGSAECDEDGQVL